MLRRQEDALHATAGDRIIVRSTHVGEPDRDGEVLEARGPDGTPPYLVRWSETGHQGLFYPGPETVIHHDAAQDIPAR